MFLTADADRARSLARQLHQQNAGRQKVEALIREACEQRGAVDNPLRRSFITAMSGTAVYWES